MNKASHEDKALWNILHGQEPEKKVWVSGGLEKKDIIGDSVEEIVNREAVREILRTARMPWFCPNEDCKKIMNKKLDDKMWYIHGMCFGCVLKMETRLRASGEWEAYEKKKMKANQISFLKDYRSYLEDLLKNVSNPTFISEGGEVEKWSGPDLTKVRTDIEKDLQQVVDVIEELTNGSIEENISE